MFAPRHLPVRIMIVPMLLPKRLTHSRRLKMIALEDYLKGVMYVARLDRQARIELRLAPIV
jgi:hypothetical protein